jgi:hypothetical protein
VTEQDERKRRWYPDDRDYRRIWEHLARQRDLDPKRQVRLDDGRVVGVGSDAAGEGDD